MLLTLPLCSCISHSAHISHAAPSVAMKRSWQVLSRVLVLVGLARLVKSSGCPSGWFEFSDYCYQVQGVSVDNSKSWIQARHNCRINKPSAHLVSIHLQSEQDFVTNLLQGNASNVASLYIGLNSRQSKGGYQWSDNSPVSYTHWKSGFVTGQGKDCIAMETVTGYWIDRMCDDITGYICKLRNPTKPAAPTRAPPSISSQLFCDSGWNQYGVYCYQYQYTKSSYHNTECSKNSQSSLAVIHSIYEQAFILSSVPRGGDVWIGLNDVNHEGQYTWLDGSSVDYTNWGYGEPNSKLDSEDCVLMNSTTSHWSDETCDQQNSYLCQKAAVPKSPPVVSSMCTSGWVSFNGHCYLLHAANATLSLNYTEAKSYCQTQQAYLAHINDIYENAFLVAQFPLAGGDSQHRMWVGLNDMQTEGLYQWTDGWPVTFTSWRPRQPDDARHSEDCVELYVRPSDRLVDGIWNDRICGARQGFICEKRPDAATPTNTPAPTTVSAMQCTHGWVKWNNFCYKFDSPIRLTWTDAHKRCLHYGADLVSLHSQDEVSFVVHQAQSAKWTHSVWIGLNDRNVEGGYVWSDGSPVSFTHWSRGQPNNWFGQQDCIEMFTSRATANWNDLACNQIRNFACKISIVSSPVLWNPTLPPYYGNSCPSDWIGHGLYCYAFYGQDSSDRKTFTDALTACQHAQGGDLISITSLDEQEFIGNYIVSLNDSDFTSSMWTGLTDAFKDGTFQWIDKATLSFNYWGPGQPSHGQDQDCVVLVNGQFWDDDECTKLHSYICKRLRPGATAPSYNIPNPITNGFCPTSSNWVAIGGYCYLANSTHLSWVAAESYCNSQGAHLTSLLSDGEATSVVSNVIQQTTGMGSNVWIGLNDREKEHSYEWTDGVPILITSWYRYQPNDYGGEQNCVYLNTRQGGWNDQYCTAKYPFVCKRSKIPYPTTMPPTTVTPKTTVAGCDTTYNQLGQSTHVVCLSSCRSYLNYPVWGWQIYTDDSSVCRAATQAGLLDDGGGEVEVIGLGNRDVFTASNSHGIVSSAHGPSEAFTFKFKLPPLCGLGWIQHGSSCYQIVPSVDSGITALSWQAAEQSCQKQGAHLVVISSERERSYLQSQFSQGTGQMWIGLTDADKEGNYVWTDGSPLMYHLWAQGEPQDMDHSQNCIEMDPNVGDDPGAWRDNYCNSHRGYICEKLLVDGHIATIGPTSQSIFCSNDSMTFGTACYSISPGCNGSQCVLDWTGAQAACVAVHNESNLLSIHSLAELQFVQQWMHQLRYQQVWIGLNDIEDEGRYVWSDKSPVNETGLYWKLGQPDDTRHSSNCVALNTADGMFSDENCMTLLPYACKVAYIPSVSVPISIRSSGGSGGGISTGAIIGIVVGLILIAVVAVGIIWLVRRRRRRAIISGYAVLSKQLADCTTEDEDDTPISLD